MKKISMKAEREIQPVRPLGLKPGDSIGIAAPAGAFGKQDLEPGIRLLKEMGYSVRIPESLCCRQRYLAGSDHHRADIMNRFFSDQSIRAIVCARGGFGSMRVLDRLDFEAVRRNPKIFIGFSDITALLWTLFSRCGMVVFHGPVLTSLKHSDPMSLDCFRHIFSSNRPVRIEPDAPRVLRPGSGSGPVVGGNLTTLCHLVGTAYQPDFDGKLLLLEDRGEPVYKIDRMLTQLKMAGCFRGVSGILLGSFESCGSEEEIFEVVLESFSEEPVPILAGFPIGHGTRNATLPLGIEATLDTGQGLLRFHQSSLAEGDRR